MKQPEQSYTAIETAHGFVFFTDTTEGQKNRQDFLQFMADHYFDPHFNLGPVNVYRAEGVLKDGSYVNPGMRGSRPGRNTVVSATICIVPAAIATVISLIFWRK